MSENKEPVTEAAGITQDIEAQTRRMVQELKALRREVQALRRDVSASSGMVSAA